MDRGLASVRKYVVFALLVCSLAIAGSWAQSGTSSLHGTVSDKSGAFVTGAKVTLTNPELSLTRETTSGSEGEFDFPRFRPCGDPMKPEPPELAGEPVPNRINRIV